MLPKLKERVRAGGVGRAAATAVKDAARQLGLPAPGRLVVKQHIGGKDQAVIFAKNKISLTVIPARLVYQPVGNQLVLAWDVAISETSGQHWWNARVDANTGKVVALYDWSAHADDAYNVYALPAESPDETGRTLVTNPATDASRGGWHNTDADAAPEFTITRGNNVHAYPDREQQQPARRGVTRRRRRPHVRLPDRPRRPAGRLPGRRDGQRVLREQRHPRRPLHLWLRREGRQLPGQQLEQERGQGQRPGARRGPGRQRPQQRQLQHPAGRLLPGDADVRVAVGRAEPDPRQHRSPRRPDVLRADGRIRRQPRDDRADHRRRRPRRPRLRPGLPGRQRPADPGRSVPGRPGRQDRADRPRRLHVRLEGQEGPGRRRAHGDRRQQRRRRARSRWAAATRPSRSRRSWSASPTAPRSRRTPVQRHDLGRHRRRARPRLRPRHRRDRPRVRPRRQQPPDRWPRQRQLPQQRRADGRGLE